MDYNLTKLKPYSAFVLGFCIVDIASGFIHIQRLNPTFFANTDFFKLLIYSTGITGSVVVFNMMFLAITLGLIRTEEESKKIEELIYPASILGVLVSIFPLYYPLTLAFENNYSIRDAVLRGVWGESYISLVTIALTIGFVRANRKRQSIQKINPVTPTE